MNINWYVIVLGIILTCFSYMFIPFILKKINGRYEEKKAGKISLWNSLVIGSIYFVLTCLLVDSSEISTWNLGPTFFYYYINYTYLSSGTLKSTNKKNKVQYCKYCGIKIENDKCPKCNIKNDNIIKKFFIILLIVLGIIFALFMTKIIYQESKSSKLVKEKEYYCPKDYKLDGKQCIKVEIISANKNYYCSIGSLVGTQCVTESTYYATTRYTCPSGYTLSGSKCYKMGTYTSYSNCGYDMTYSYTDGRCYSKITAIKTLQCTLGQLVGSNCIQKRYYQALYNYTCPSGYNLNYASCERQIIIDAYEK